VTDERAIEEVDEPHSEPSGATTRGLATRFVGSRTRTAEKASETETISTDSPDPVTAPTDPVTRPTAPVTAAIPAVTAVPPAPPILEKVIPPAPPIPPALPVAPSEASPESETATGATPQRDGTKVLKAGLVASTIGLCALMFVGYVYDFSNLQQHRGQRALLNQFTTADKAQVLSGRTVAEGNAAGVLTIPALGLSQVIVEGTSATDLLKGPGLMPGTAQPGSLGNSVIAGHRTIAGSPFAHLDSLRAGDRIEVVTARGAYRYNVIAVGSARPGAPDPISPNRHPQLTLVTSGGSTASLGRSYVVATLITAPNRIPIPRDPPSTAQRGLGGDSSAVLPAILWGLVLGAGLAVMFLAYWRFRGRHWSVYVLSTPVLLAMAFLWYENLIRLLPATM
jgi:sortase A